MIRKGGRPSRQPVFRTCVELDIPTCDMIGTLQNKLKLQKYEVIQMAVKVYYTKYSER